MNKLLSTVGKNKASMNRLLLCNSRTFSMTSKNPMTNGQLLS